MHLRNVLIAVVLSLNIHHVYATPGEIDHKVIQAMTRLAISPRIDANSLGSFGTIYRLTEEQIEDIGFDGKRYYSRLEGETIQIDLFVVVYREEVMFLRASMDKRARHLIRDRLDVASQVRVGLHDSKDTDFSRRFHSVEKAYYDRVGMVLGRQYPLDLPEAKSQAYERLLFPFWPGAYGEQCGLVGLEPESRKAFREMLQIRSPKVFQNLLRGYSPEGRMYGVEGLVALRKVPWSFWSIDRAVVNRLHSLGLTFRRCGGCMFYASPYPSSNALRRDRSLRKL